MEYFSPSFALNAMFPNSQANGLPLETFARIGSNSTNATAIWSIRTISTVRRMARELSRYHTIANDTARNVCAFPISQGSQCNETPVPRFPH
jgi:hypothetical protein